MGLNGSLLAGKAMVVNEARAKTNDDTARAR